MLHLRTLFPAMLGLQIANILFFVFHTLLIFFNVFGWVWKRSRLWNLVSLAGTAFSWGVMGIWKGAGYCICTDWHWQVRRAMGIRETSSSYLVLLIRNITGWDPPTDLVNSAALAIFLICLMASVGLNLRDAVQKRRATRHIESRV